MIKLLVTTAMLTGLTACQTVSQTVVNALPESVITKVREGCEYELTRATAVSLVAVFTGIHLEDIVNEVCGAVKSVPRAAAVVTLFNELPPTARVRGVVIQGHFVSPRKAR